MTNEQQIKSWIAGYPRKWANLCQALMWRLCEALGLVPYDGIDSATDAYNIERNAGRIRTDAPPATGGVFIYFFVPGVPDGHVGYLMNGGRVFMTSNGSLIEEWTNSNAGYSTIAEYIRTHPGAYVRGWSPLNGGNSVSNWTPDDAPAPAPSGGFEQAPGGEPNAPYWPVGELMARIQRGLSKRGRYNNADGSPRPDDGIGGHFTAVGIQTTLNVSGRNGGVYVADYTMPTPEDGKLGRNNAYGVQEYGQDFGGGPDIHDGDPRTNGWTAFAVGLETD